MIEDTVFEWVKVYGQNLVGRKVYFRHIRREFRDGGIIFESLIKVFFIKVRAVIDPRLERLLDKDTIIRMDVEEFDKLPKVDIIRMQVRDKLQKEVFHPEKFNSNSVEF